MSFYDDTYYVSVALRMAHGLRPFVGETSMQATGQMLPAAFVWLWDRAIGTTGLMLAYRIFYILFAAAAAAAVCRVLRGSFPLTAAALAAVVAVISPPFNIFTASYNTVALVAMAIAFVSAFAVWRTGGRIAAVASGTAMVLASVSYLPLAVASATLFVTLAVLVRDRRLLGWVALGGVGAAVPLLGWLVPSVSIDDIRRTLAYASANVMSFESPLQKLTTSGLLLWKTLVTWTLAPAWVLAVVACVPRMPRSVRFWSLLLVPLAASASDLAWLAGLRGAPTVGHIAALWLVKFTFIAAVPAIALALQAKRHDTLRLLAMAGPCSLVGVVIVLYSTNAGIAAATYLVGMVPFVLVIAAGWADAVIGLGPVGARALAWCALLIPAMLLLFVSAFGDARPVGLSAMVSYGPYAGLRTTETRLGELRALEVAGRRYVKPADKVTFLGERSAYLVVGGDSYTSTSWLYPGPSDQAALDYFARQGGVPDVVFVDNVALKKLGKPTYEIAAENDPLVARLLTDYRLVDTVANFGVFVRQ